MTDVTGATSWRWAVSLLVLVPAVAPVALLGPVSPQIWPLVAGVTLVIAMFTLPSGPQPVAEPIRVEGTCWIIHVEPWIGFARGLVVAVGLLAVACFGLAIDDRITAVAAAGAIAVTVVEIVGVHLRHRPTELRLDPARMEIHAPTMVGVRRHVIQLRDVVAVEDLTFAAGAEINFETFAKVGVRLIRHRGGSIAFLLPMRAGGMVHAELARRIEATRAVPEGALSG